MNVGEVLQNTLSPDANIRVAATQHLENAARDHWTAYMGMLSQELANEQSPSHIRNAAGLALKNALTAREVQRREEAQQKWLAMGGGEKQQIKTLAIQALHSNDSKAGQVSAQFIAAIAAIELPQNQWPELMSTLVQNVSESSGPHLKQASLQAIGYICESVDRNILPGQSNAILTAVVQGARKEEPSRDVQLAALHALYDSLEFVSENFEREGERNYIMQVVCEATQNTDVQIQEAAFACLVRIMQLYYDKMRFYMEKALFGLTVLGMKSNEEKVALQAIEFWSTVCEEEIEVNLENQEAMELGERPDRECYNFAKVALPEVLPVLLQLLCTQSEDDDDEDWNRAMASATCLQHLAQTVEGVIVGPVLGFIESNIRAENWKQREAAVMAFGSILEGPEIKMLENLVQQALPVLISMMADPVVQVKDTTAWTLGRVSDMVISAISPEVHLPGMMASLISGLGDNPRIVANCCWAIMNLSEQLGGDAYESQTSVMSAYYENLIAALLHVTERPGNENNSRTSAYEALGTLVQHSAMDVLPMVANVAGIVLQRLEATVAMQNQILGMDDRTAHEELQSNLCGVLTSVVRRLSGEVGPQADRIMTVLLQLTSNAGNQSIIHEDVFLAIGALTQALEDAFAVYLDTFIPFLNKALANHEEYQLCSIAVGLIGDISRALSDKVAPYCDQFMNALLVNLQSPVLHRNVKPAILSCFGDIALAIGADFQKYLEVVMQVLQQASGMQASPDDGFDMIDYVNQLREGIVEAYVGIVQAFKGTGKADILLPYVQHVFGFLSVVHGDQEKTEGLTRSMIGLIGDLAETFPNGQLKTLLLQDWITDCLKQGRSKAGYQQSTKETARWAREMVNQARK